MSRLNKEQASFMTPGGEKMVAVPEEEYINLLNLADRVQEDADIAEVRKIQADISEGRSEYIPSDFVKKLLFGDVHPIVLWRKYRGMTGRELSKAAGTTAVHLSNIENFKKSGGIGIYQKIAVALNVTVDDLLPRIDNE